MSILIRTLETNGPTEELIIHNHNMMENADKRCKKRLKHNKIIVSIQENVKGFDYFLFDRFSFERVFLFVNVEGVDGIIFSV